MPQRATPGEGRPYQRSADGRWVVAVRDGENRRRYVYGLSRPQVIAKRDEWNAAVRAGLRRPGGKLTVGKQLADWLADRRGKVRPATWASYEGIVRIHLASVAPVQLGKLTPADVRRLLRERTAAHCAPRTVGYALTVLRMAIAQAVRDGLILRNVATFVDPPRAARQPLRVWSPAEARRFLEATHDDPLGGLWAVLVGTGVRLGEAIGLRWADVDRAGGTITISGSIRVVPRVVRAEGEVRLARVEPKTEAGWRTMVAPAFVLLALAEEERRGHRRPANLAGLAFTTPRGTALDPRNVNRAFEAARAALGLPRIRLHDLRHTAASLLLAQGFTLEDVKRMLGHSSIAMTSDIYGHLLEGRSRELAAGMDRLLGARV